MNTYNYTGIKGTSLTPLCRIMLGNGPYPWAVDEVEAWVKARPRTPLVLTRDDPHRPLIADDDGRPWSMEKLRAGHEYHAAELYRRKIKIDLLADNAERDWSDEMAEKYFLACVRPYLKYNPDLQWANYATRVDSLLAKIQTVMTPSLYLWDDREATNPPRTGEQIVDWSLDQLAANELTGKPVFAWIASIDNAGAAVTLDHWRTHAEQVMRRANGVLLFDETRQEGQPGYRGFDGGKASRADVSKITKAITKAGANDPAQRTP